MHANTAEELFSFSLNFLIFDANTIEKAKSRFEELQVEGIIKDNCTFDGNVWYATNEYSNVGLDFNISILKYENYKKIFSLEINNFISKLKSYILSKFGSFVLESLRCFLLDMQRIIATDYNQICTASENIKLYSPSLCSDFFSLLLDYTGDKKLEKLICAMDAYADIRFASASKNQRSLPQFHTFFIFNDLLDDFWASELSDDDRLFYYPLYLWWTITAVLPLRPREFLLTPRDCLSVDDSGNHHIQLRKSKIKGYTSNRISHKIDNDYTIYKYMIPEKIYIQIKKYTEMTAIYDSTDINTLFIPDPHYRKFNWPKFSKSRFLTYRNMLAILQCFYRDIVIKKYKLDVISNNHNRHLKENEIGLIHLGDTRHIALINIMQSGGTPVTAMLLAGHNNATIASHYYSNITSMIECKTYRQYRRISSGNLDYKLSFRSPLPIASISVELSDGGKCYSRNFQNGQIDDCLSVIGENAEIGYCPECMHYRKKGISFFGAEKVFKKKIENDCNALLSAIDHVRKFKGAEEKIGEALLKLKSSSLSYEQYLTEKQKMDKLEV